MKTKLLSLFLIASATLAAQSFKIIEKGIDVSGKTVTINGSTNDIALNFEPEVENTGTSSKKTRCKRYEVYYIANTSNYICWGAHCESPFSHSGGSDYFYTHGDILDLLGTTTTFSAHYCPNGNQGASKYCYVFFDKNNPGDSCFVNVIYNISAASGISKMDANNALLLYPNPAAEQATLQVNHTSLKIEAGTVKLYNSMGELLQSEINYNTSKEQNTVSINTAPLNNGVYWLTVPINEGILTRKLVVSH